MAGADVIEAAIGITLLLIVSYVVIGSIITAADTVSTAQKDITISQEERLGTSIEISNLIPTWNGLSHDFKFDLKNTGSKPIGNFNNTDVFISILGGVPVWYSFAADKVGTGGDASSQTWSYITISPDNINVRMLDPGETMKVQINNVVLSGAHTTYLSVVTQNGVSASALYTE